MKKEKIKKQLSSELKKTIVTNKTIVPINDSHDLTNLYNLIIEFLSLESDTIYPIKNKGTTKIILTERQFQQLRRQYILAV